MTYNKFKILYYLDSFFKEFNNFEGIDTLYSYYHELHNQIMNNCCDVYELCCVEEDFNIFNKDIESIYTKMTGNNTFNFKRK